MFERYEAARANDQVMTADSDSLFGAAAVLIGILMIFLRMSCVSHEATAPAAPAAVTSPAPAEELDD